MKNLSRYQLFIKNEQQKVKNVVGICLCGGSSNNRYSSENTAQDDLDLIQNMYYRASFNNINSSRCGGERRRNRRSRQSDRDTNVYRFENQGFISNSLGTSNSLVERSKRSERSAIDKILRKYMRKDNF